MVTALKTSNEPESEVLCPFIADKVARIEGEVLIIRFIFFL